VQSTAIADIYSPRLDARGDAYVVASMLSRGGCQTRILERAAGGTIHRLRASSIRRDQDENADAYRNGPETAGVYAVNGRA
jgi:hypothetical protein